MPEHIKYEDDDLFNAETHHESSDVPVRGLLWFIVVFIVFGILTHLAILFFYKTLAGVEQRREDPPQTAVARPANADVPQNQPLLEPFPTADGKGTVVPPQSNTPVTNLHALRTREEQVLKSYGWIDRERGIVRMPIANAKSLLAARLAVQGQLAGGTVPATPPATQPVPGANPAPAGNQPPADTGAVHPATTNTTGGTHQ
ncbi:MAG TPA: hypothetical protein VF911_13505 [Thermoanaerobaculia bacterium]|jgi:hypothetical protein